MVAFRNHVKPLAAPGVVVSCPGEQADVPVARAQVLVRRPVGEVFNAFVEPAVTTKFWFTKSSGRLVPGAELTWEWEMYGASAAVTVREVEPDTRILIERVDPPCPVEWVFSPRPDGTTLVAVSNWGFVGSDDEAVAQALDSMGGFTSLLAGLEAFLEHGIELGLVADHAPDAWVS